MKMADMFLQRGDEDMDDMTLLAFIWWDIFEQDLDKLQAVKRLIRAMA